MGYKKTHYVVEVPIGVDVFAKDYGKDRECAMRALSRLAVARQDGIARYTALRLWHDGGCIMSKSYDYAG